MRAFGHAGPVTTGIDSLAPSDTAGLHWAHTAVAGGPWETDAALAKGYLAVADTAMEHWKARHPNTAMAIPIIANYRHGIELALKAEIREAARCLRRDGDDDPAIQADQVDQQLSATHSIGRLSDRLTELIGRLKLVPADQRLPAGTLEVLRKLHLLDETGQAFRYAAVKAGTGPRRRRVLQQARPGQEHFDMMAVAEALRDAAEMLLYGVDGVLDEYSDWQDNMAEWAISLMP
ncbi:MAG: hypothetical protein JWM19_1349 [Actinomycetia bacterium]|nr:hypothetical protein [Actinomycetes bacterium]